MARDSSSGDQGLQSTEEENPQQQEQPQQGGEEQDPRTSAEKDEKYRFANNIPAKNTVPERQYQDYVLEYDDDDASLNDQIPDVLLDVPVVKVDRIDFELNDLRARVSLQAEVLDLVKLNVGVDAYLGRVKLVIEGVEAQVLLKVRLDNVTRILDRVLTTIDRNPEIIQSLRNNFV